MVRRKRGKGRERMEKRKKVRRGEGREEESKEAYGEEYKEK